MRGRARRASASTFGAALVVIVVAAPLAAFAQNPGPPESIELGAWTFRPSVELRLRGQYTRNPVDSGGAVFSSTAVLDDAYRMNTPPIVAVLPGTRDQWFVAERARLGLAVDRGPVTAAVILQDARALGSTDAALIRGPAEPTLPSLAPFEAYIDVHSARRTIFLRLGRQRIAWGNGRLLGEDDWAPTARSLDAVRIGGLRGDVEIEAFAALLAAPGALPPAVTGLERPVATGSGAQLYGLDLVWRALPLLSAELTGLARVVRDPVPTDLAAGDTFVADGRLFGDHRGFRWDLEGAYEAGQVRSFGDNRRLSAFAAAGQAELETRLPWHLTFNVRGAYATGESDAQNPRTTLHRFDPILPDERTTLSPMGMYAWSNLIEAGGGVAMRPSDELALDAGYRFAGLAAPTGRWSTSALTPIGAAPSNTSHVLGHEIDLSASYHPWQAVEFLAGYGLFLNGAAAKAVLASSNRRSESAVQWAFVQARVRAP
jgi:hypothetical protein